MPAFAPNLGPAQEPWCVAGGNPDQAREAKPDIMFRDFFPPAGATENPEPQQVKSIDHENAAGPGVAGAAFDRAHRNAVGAATKDALHHVRLHDVERRMPRAVGANVI